MTAKRTPKKREPRKRAPRKRRTENLRELRRVSKRTGVTYVRWEAYVSIGRDPDGKHRTLSRTFERKGAAKRWVREQKGYQDGGGQRVLTSDTVAQWLERWLALHARNVAPSTAASYRDVLRRWVLTPHPGIPRVGGYRLVKVTTEAFDKLYQHLADRGVVREITLLHGILKRAFRDAVRKKHLTHNPVADATVPKPVAERVVSAAPDAPRLGKTGTGKAFSPAQAQAFLSAAAKDDRLSAYWHLLLLTGLRPSEGLGLVWPDVDLEGKVVHVRASLCRSGLDKERFPLRWARLRPKTDLSQRVVPLSDLAVRELRKWKAVQAAERLQLGAAWQDHNLVFTTPLGTPLFLANLQRRWRRVLEQAEKQCSGFGHYGPEPKKPRSGPTKRRPFIPNFRIYDLRHSAATLLLKDGVPLLDVSRLLGHSTILLTANTYAHVSREQLTAAVGRFDTMFGT
jgi:integrase